MVYYILFIYYNIKKVAVIRMLKRIYFGLFTRRKVFKYVSVIEKHLFTS